MDSIALATTSTCLDLTISVPGSSSTSILKMKPLTLPSKRPKPEDINWINIGFSNSLEEVDDIDTDSPHENRTRRGESDDNPPRKKLRLTKEQSQILEERFLQNHTLSPKQKEELAARLRLRPRQVEVWFQNRRARSKLKQTEIECEYLKRWFDSLTEQNRKLQKELAELRAMKKAQLYALSSQTSEPGPVKSLTMCPRCERVSTKPAYAEKPSTGSTKN